MPAFLLPLFSSPWVQKVLFPLVSYVFFKALDKYQSDPEFAKGMDEAAAQWKSATSKKEKLDASTKFQDSLFR